MDIIQALYNLSNAPGPPGAEDVAAKLACSLLAPFCAEVEVDLLGNVIGRFLTPPEKPNRPVVLLDAHLDEVGIIVTGEKDGFYLFGEVGKLDPRILPGTVFNLLTEPPVRAVVASLPPHLQRSGDGDKVRPIDELFLDTGGAPAQIGTYGVFEAKPALLGSLVTGKALDDRAGFAAILRALELIGPNMPNADLVVCGSVQEEVGCRGAAVAAYGIAPDYAVAVDVTYGSSPDSTGINTFSLGGGVCINHGPDCNRALTDRLVKIAKDKGIPHQIEVTAGLSRTNATPIQTARHGAATAVLSIPLRNMHTPAETVHTGDIEACAQLLKEWVLSI